MLPGGRAEFRRHCEKDTTYDGNGPYIREEGDNYRPIIVTIIQCLRREKVDVLTAKPSPAKYPAAEIATSDAEIIGWLEGAVTRMPAAGVRCCRIQRIQCLNVLIYDVLETESTTGLIASCARRRPIGLSRCHSSVVIACREP